jgi:NhaA family Na+:H+ antiporter
MTLAKLGILSGSILSAVLGYVILGWRLKQRAA